MTIIFCFAIRADKVSDSSLPNPKFVYTKIYLWRNFHTFGSNTGQINSKSIRQTYSIKKKEKKTKRENKNNIIIPTVAPLPVGTPKGKRSVENAPTNEPRIRWGDKEVTVAVGLNCVLWQVF